MNEFRKMEDEKSHDFSLLISVVVPKWQDDGSLDLTLRKRRSHYIRTVEDHKLADIEDDTKSFKFKQA